MHFELSPLAKVDAQEITDYYADISSDLAEGFVRELGDNLGELCLQPELGSRRYAHFLSDRSLRFWPLNRFPYLLFYRTAGNRITLIRILHRRRSISSDMITDDV